MKFVVEDNIILQNEICSAGSKMLYNFRPPFQGEAVKRALAAGWEVAGQADVGEFAMDGSGHTCFRGAVQNPLKEGYCGSGAAAAVKAGQADVGMVVDIGGDALRLAAQSGCVGFRPTYGRVSRSGIVSMVASTEQISAVAQSVAEAASLIGAVAGHDDKDGTSLPEQSYDYTVPDNISGLKIAVIGEMPQVEEQLIAAGAKVEHIAPKWLEWGGKAFQVMASAEGCNNISRFDGVKYGYRAPEYRDIEELYVNSRSQAFGPVAKVQAVLGTYFLSKGRYEEYYYKALQLRRLIRDEYTQIFSQYDVVLSWGSQGGAYKQEADIAELVRADRDLTAAAAIAGLPAAMVPDNAGELPRAIQVAANSGQDKAALAVAAILEGGNK